MTDPQNMASSIVDRYRSDQNIVKRLMGMLPLYSQSLGKAEYEMADNLLRKEIADKLAGYKEHLRRAEEVFVKKNLLAQIGKTEPAASLIDRLALSIRSASYGLSGMGSGFKPGEQELQSLTNLDGALLQAAVDMEARFLEIAAAASEKPEEVEAKVSAIVTELMQYDRSFQARKSIFTGVK